MEMFDIYVKLLDSLDSLDSLLILHTAKIDSAISVLHWKRTNFNWKVPHDSPFSLPRWGH